MAMKCVECFMSEKTSMMLSGVTFLCAVVPPVAFGIYALIAVPTLPSPLMVSDFVGMEATIQCDAGELKRTEAAIKVAASLLEGVCEADPTLPDVAASVLAAATNAFDCGKAEGLWTPTGTVTMETLKAEGFFVDMVAIESFSDACSTAKIMAILALVQAGIMLISIGLALKDLVKAAAAVGVCGACIVGIVNIVFLIMFIISAQDLAECTGDDVDTLRICMYFLIVVIIIGCLNGGYNVKTGNGYIS